MEKLRPLKSKTFSELMCETNKLLDNIHESNSDRVKVFIDEFHSRLSDECKSLQEMITIIKTERITHD